MAAVKERAGAVIMILDRIGADARRIASSAGGESCSGRVTSRRRIGVVRHM